MRDNPAFPALPRVKIEPLFTPAITPPAKAAAVHDVIVMIGACVVGAWVSDFIREAYSLSDPPIEVHLGDGDHIFPDIGRTTGEKRVMMMLGPGRRQMERVASGTMPIVVALDDPIDSVRYAMVANGQTFLDALRYQTKMAAAHHLYVQNPAVFPVERGTEAPARAILAAMMAHLHLQVPAAAEPALLERFGGPVDTPWTLETALAHTVPLHAPLDKPGDAIGADEATLVRQSLSPLVRGATSYEIGPIVWSAKVFLLADQFLEVVPPVTELAGAPRTIFHGPYFHLPPGVWKVAIVLGFSAEAKGSPFRLVILANSRPIATALLTPEHGGAFQGIFTLRHVDPEHHIEVNFRNDEGTIEGRVALGHVTFVRIGLPAGVDHRQA